MFTHASHSRSPITFAAVQTIFDYSHTSIASQLPWHRDTV
ncbi:hypothetical protein BIFGAL_03749 [Bifidobacterium gallicum DSM 20093 = LMG 11596]|uniref:Uncharacterized protein n=1 Tax=Bifidobacterium gallicum DSM 20093 = LMG 11596 TaxID=561180 RepID=D1NV65_9BIFI|nr:hypothetical protein BIFGAL_03749 [Bifidobacterium gallicum DSM 20093 = LMG 11596]